MKVLIRLRGCAGWSAPLFAYGINRFSHDVKPHCSNCRIITTIFPVPVSVLYIYIYIYIYIKNFLRYLPWRRPVFSHLLHLFHLSQDVCQGSAVKAEKQEWFSLFFVFTALQDYFTHLQLRLDKNWRSQRKVNWPLTSRTSCDPSRAPTHW